jgi:hypothetical protein
MNHEIKHLDPPSKTSFESLTTFMSDFYVELPWGSANSIDLARFVDCSATAFSAFLFFWYVPRADTCV